MSFTCAPVAFSFLLFFSFIKHWQRRWCVCVSIFLLFWLFQRSSVKVDEYDSLWLRFWVNVLRLVFFLFRRGEAKLGSIECTRWKKSIWFARHYSARLMALLFLTLVTCSSLFLCWSGGDFKYDNERERQRWWNQFTWIGKWSVKMTQQWQRYVQMCGCGWSSHDDKW